MDRCEVETSTVQVGARAFRLCALVDRQQYSDPDGAGARAGICSAGWPMFGVLWPSGRVLAERMVTFPVAGRRILEVGCGLGLPSLVLQSRGADVTASDHHPLAETFLRRNARLNDLGPVPFWTGSWATSTEALGRFDVIIAGDVLYERDHPALLARFVSEHAAPTSEVLVADPGRGQTGKLGSRMALLGYTRTDEHCRFEASEDAPFKGRVSQYRRG